LCRWRKHWCPRHLLAEGVSPRPRFAPNGSRGLKGPMVPECWYLVRARERCTVVGPVEPLTDGRSIFLFLSPLFYSFSLDTSKFWHRPGVQPRFSCCRPALSTKLDSETILPRYLFNAHRSSPSILLLWVAQWTITSSHTRLFIHPFHAASTADRWLFIYPLFDTEVMRKLDVLSSSVLLPQSPLAPFFKL